MSNHSNYLLFNVEQDAIDFEREVSWDWYLSTQPDVLKSDGIVKGYRRGGLSKVGGTVRFYDIISSNGKYYLGPIGYRFPESCFSEETLETYSGLLKTYQWMVDNSYIIEE